MMQAPRVGYLLKKFPRLSETFVLNEILGQERLGVPLHVFSRREPDEEPRHPQLAELRAEVEVLPSMRGVAPWVTLFEQAAADPGLMPRFGELARELASFEHERMHQLFAEALHLLPRTRELSIEHLHVHFATDSAVTAMILAELGGPGFSITAHAKDIYRSTVDPRLLSRLVARSRFTVTVCDANVRFLEEKLEPDARAKLRRLYNGISLEDFSPDGGEPEPEHVLGVGRLVAKKGFDVLIDAVAMLADRRPGLRATIVGEGEERAALEARIEERGLQDRVQLLGGLDSAQVLAWMRRATLLCLPCRVGDDGNRDALPTVLLEALAVGLPCVSTGVSGVPEILDEGRAGLLVPEEDAHATAQAMARLLDDAGLRGTFSRHGRAHAERHFDGRASARVLGQWFAEHAGAARVA